MKYQVPIVIEPLEEGGYYAECPILSGCHVEGATYSETLDYLDDVIRLHIEGRLEFGDPLPLTRSNDFSRSSAWGTIEIVTTGQNDFNRYYEPE